MYSSHSLPKRKTSKERSMEKDFPEVTIIAPKHKRVESFEFTV
jgi:hypothetical protein